MRTHGLVSTYVHGCRCPECRGAKARDQRDRRHGRKVKMTPAIPEGAAIMSSDRPLWELANGTPTRAELLALRA